MPGGGSEPSRRKLALFVVPIAIVLSTLLPGVVAAREPQPFSFEKDCPGTEPYCVIHDASAPFEFLDGMSVWYVGPGLGGKVIGDRMFISYEVVIGPSADAFLATGHFRWLGDHGSWTIRRGVGQLAGLHAEGEMSFVGCVDETCTFVLTGTYHIDP